MPLKRRKSQERTSQAGVPQRTDRTRCYVSDEASDSFSVNEVNETRPGQSTQAPKPAPIRGQPLVRHDQEQHHPLVNERPTQPPSRPNPSYPDDSWGYTNPVSPPPNMAVPPPMQPMFTAQSSSGPQPNYVLFSSNTQGTAHGHDSLLGTSANNPQQHFPGLCSSCQGPNVPYQQRFPYGPLAPPPLPQPSTELPARANPIIKKEDPERLRMELEIKALREAQERAQALEKQKQIESQIRKDAEEAAYKRFEAQRIANEEAMKQIEQARREGERAAAEKYEAEQRARQDKELAIAEHKTFIEEEMRFKLEMEKLAEEAAIKTKKEETEEFEKWVKERITRSIVEATAFAKENLLLSLEVGGGMDERMIEGDTLKNKMLKEKPILETTTEDSQDVEQEQLDIEPPPHERNSDRGTSTPQQSRQSDGVFQYQLAEEDQAENDTGSEEEMKSRQSEHSDSSTSGSAKSPTLPEPSTAMMKLASLNPATESESETSNRPPPPAPDAPGMPPYSDGDSSFSYQPRYRRRGGRYHNNGDFRPRSREQPPLPIEDLVEQIVDAVVSRLGQSSYSDGFGHRPSYRQRAPRSTRSTMASSVSSSRLQEDHRNRRLDGEPMRRNRPARKDSTAYFNDDAASSCHGEFHRDSSLEGYCSDRESSRIVEEYLSTQGKRVSVRKIDKDGDVPLRIREPSAGNQLDMANAWPKSGDISPENPFAILFPKPPRSRKKAALTNTLQSDESNQDDNKTMVDIEPSTRAPGRKARQWKEGWTSNSLDTVERGYVSGSTRSTE